MSEQDKLISVIESYFELHGISNCKRDCFVKELSEASCDDEGVCLYEGKSYLVLSMDDISQNGYRELFDSCDYSKHNILKSVDALMVDKDTNIYLIEFKNRSIKGDNIKDNVIIKALSNLYMLFDMLYYAKNNGNWYIKDIELDNPINFIRNHVDYILVYSGEKNYEYFRSLKGAILSKKKYIPPVLQKLNDYVFRNAYAYDEKYFKKEFVEKFKY